MSQHVADYREARALAQERADALGVEVGIRRTTDLVAGRRGYTVAMVCDNDRYTAEIVQPRRRTRRDDTDCCATHAGPHAPAMDAYWHQKNRQFLERCDQHVAAGEGVGATTALMAFLREEQQRLRIKAWEIAHGLYDGWACPWPREEAP